MKKCYELVSLIFGLAGIIFTMIGVVSFVYFVKMTMDSVESWWWKSLVFEVVGLSFMIPMAIYSKRAFALEVQEVKNKTSVELDNWIEETAKKTGVEYVNGVMRKAGYAQRWVKNNE
jgi:hypothetical protein